MLKAEEKSQALKREVIGDLLSQITKGNTEEGVERLLGFEPDEACRALIKMKNLLRTYYFSLLENQWKIKLGKVSCAPFVFLAFVNKIKVLADEATWNSKSPP